MTKSATSSGEGGLRWIQHDGCVVTDLEGGVEFSASAWDAWLHALSETESRKWIWCARGDIQPSKSQWRQATRLIRDAGSTVAVVTDSRHTAALAKAASWLGIEMRAFRWNQIYDATMFVGLPSQQRIALRAHITAVRDRHGPRTANPELGSIQAAGSKRTSTSTAASAPPRARAVAPAQPAAPARKRPRVPSLVERPMTAAASRNLDDTRRTSEEIHASLARIQARLRKLGRTSETDSPE